MKLLLIVMMGVFLVCGIFMFTVSLRELLRKFQRRHRFASAEGVVMKVQRKKISTNRHRFKPLIMNFPVIRFTTHSGESVTFVSDTGDTGQLSRYTPGTLLAIRYDPEGEFAPMLDSWLGIWLPNLLALLAGVGFLFGTFLIGWAFGDKLFGG